MRPGPGREGLPHEDKLPHVDGLPQVIERAFSKGMCALGGLPRGSACGGP